MGGSISKKGTDESEDATMRGGEVVGTGGAHVLGGGGGGGGAGAAAAGAGAGLSPSRAVPASAGGGPAGAAGAAPSGDGVKVVPTVFRWEHGGNSVFITGTFNGWEHKIPLHRSGNDFLSIQNLPATKHAYKFVVDDEWRFAPDLPTMTDVEGNINNIIDLSTFALDEVDREEDYVPWSTGTRAAALLRRRDSFKDTTPYGHQLPEEDSYHKEPPNLPPQLRNIILNSPNPDSPDPMQTEVPMHVTLNHLYCTAIRDGLMMQATTGRYRRKYFSTIFLSPDSSFG